MSPTQVHQFYDVGYILVPDLFSSREVEQMLDCVEVLEKEAKTLSGTGKDGKVLHKGSEFVLGDLDAESRFCVMKRVVWAGACVPKLLEFGRSPKLLKMVSEILNVDKADHLVNQVHFKHPGDGVSFPLHQDSTHRRYGTELWEDVDGRGSYVQTLIALDEITEENGPLLVVPGSGREGHLNLTDNESSAELRKKFEEAHPVPILMKPGSVLFFGPYLVHGSNPNESSRSRRVFINGFSFPGANKRVYPGEGSGACITLLPLQNE